MSTLELMNIETWAPHPKAAPLTERSGETFAIAANGTRTCVGGWQLSYSGAVPGTAYAIRVKVRFSDVDEWRDRLQCVAYWGDIPADERRRRNGDVVEWDYLLPEPDGDEDVTFGRIFTAPEGTDR